MDSKSILVAGGDHHRYTLGRMCARAFEKLGHEVRYVDTNTPSLPLLGTNIGTGSMRKRFVETVSRFDPDLVFIIKGDDIPCSTLQYARGKSDATFCNWNPDNPFMARSEERSLETYLDTLPLYDIAFIWTESLVDRLYDAGAQNVFHLPFAYDPVIHRPVEPDPDFRSDVVFAGHWSEKRQRFLSAVAELDVDLAIYGNYWRWKCFDRQVRRHVRDSAVFGDEYCKAFCSSKIAINIVADHNLDAYNMRSFEIPATGSFMATTRTEGQRKILGEDEGMVCFETPAELKTLVTEYVENSDRESIAATGKERIEPHTYEKRMKAVLSTVDEVC